MNFKDLMPTYKEKTPLLFKYRFTVFTPVFNCEKSIKKVHDSLLNQTYKDFEWLIINDASTDKSHDVITQIIETSPLNIHYVNNKENKHKMSCFIQSIALAQGEFLLPFDGDDECYPNTLEVFNNEYKEIPNELKPKVAAITVNCEDQYGNPIGNLFPEDPFYCNTFEAAITNKISGEKWGFTKTEVLRNINIHPYMLTFGFIPESIIWNTVARMGFLTKCVNKTLRIYHVGVEDSIMNTPMTSKSAFGIVFNGLAINNWFLGKYFYKAPIYFLKTAYITLRSSKYLDYPLKAYIKSIDSFLIKILFIIIWPFRKFMR
ncbi:glycosyl transferase domain protein [Winogradskyella psychrotolerans RS-3]|uniref:Glycosyl transferase domain protein n=1 Tax=Winogradskyella psychrotolerans RS-3 TaxID=641526 RepID=S7WSM4_9FLAO|nr:glycosyltransferase family 2 protein [Winogradskyella psychrotolerans]EPR69724.1 glycosyl transferase domain protein [Winogradskyella psychrotolerans RS-3]